MTNQEAQTLCYHSTLSTALMEHHGNTTQLMKLARYRFKAMSRIFSKMHLKFAVESNRGQEFAFYKMSSITFTLVRRTVGILTWDDLIFRDGLKNIF